MKPLHLEDKAKLDFKNFGAVLKYAL